MRFYDMDKRVAVVILNYNGAAMLARFLPSVVEHSPEAQIVVADNGSADDSVAQVRALFPTVRVIELGCNFGFADGYNRALAQVDADYYILLNNDVEVTKGWIAPLLAQMEADEKVVACQPKILSYNNKNKFEYAGAAGGFIDYYGYPYCRGRLFDTVEGDCGQYDDPCRVFWATGAALMVRSSVFKNVGGFDAGFFAHMEEIDLCWRMLARGGDIMAIPASVVYHVGGATLAKSNPRKTYLNFRNNLLLLYKNLPTERRARVMRGRCLLDYVAAFKFLLTAGWGDFAAVVRARRDFRRMKKQYAAAREENMRLSVAVSVMSGFSLLWQYYARGRKCFSQLPKNK